MGHLSTVLYGTACLLVGSVFAHARADDGCVFDELLQDLPGYEQKVCFGPPAFGRTETARTRYAVWFTDNKLMVDRISTCVRHHPERVGELPLWSRAMVLSAVLPILLEGSDEVFETDGDAPEVQLIWRSYIASREADENLLSIPEDCRAQLDSPIRRTIRTIDAQRAITAGERAEIEANQALLDELKAKGLYAIFDTGVDTAAFYGTPSPRFVGAVPTLDLGLSYRVKPFFSVGGTLGAGWWPSGFRDRSSAATGLAGFVEGSIAFRAGLRMGGCFMTSCRLAFEAYAGIDWLPGWESSPVVVGLMNDYQMRLKVLLSASWGMSIYAGGGYRIVVVQTREFDDMSHGLARFGLIWDDLALLRWN